MKRVFIICLVALVATGGILFFCLNKESQLPVETPSENVVKKGGRRQIAEVDRAQQQKPATQTKKKTTDSEAIAKTDKINLATIDEDIEAAMDAEDYTTAVKLIQALLNRTNDPEKIVELLETLSNAGLKGLAVITKYMDVRDKEVRDRAIEIWRQEIDMLDESKEKTTLIDTAGKAIAEDELTDADAMQNMVDALFDVPENDAMKSVLEWLKVAKGKDKIKLLMEDIAFRTAEEFSSENLTQSQAIREAEAMIKKYQREMKE